MYYNIYMCVYTTIWDYFRPSIFPWGLFYTIYYCTLIFSMILWIYLGCHVLRPKIHAPNGESSWDGNHGESSWEIPCHNRIFCSKKKQTQRNIRSKTLERTFNKVKIPKKGLQMLISDIFWQMCFFQYWVSTMLSTSMSTPTERRWTLRNSWRTSMRS